MARKFFYVCGGVFLLALAYHFGAGNAHSQVGTTPEVAVLAGVLSDVQRRHSGPGKRVQVDREPGVPVPDHKRRGPGRAV